MPLQMRACCELLRMPALMFTMFTPSVTRNQVLQALAARRRIGRESGRVFSVVPEKKEKTGRRRRPVDNADGKGGRRGGVGSERKP